MKFTFSSSLFYFDPIFFILSQVDHDTRLIQADMDDFFLHMPPVPALSAYSFYPRSDSPADRPDSLYLRYFFPRLPAVIPSLLQPFGDYLPCSPSFSSFLRFVMLVFNSCFSLFLYISSVTTPISPILSEISLSPSSLQLHDGPSSSLRVSTPRPPPPPYSAPSQVSSANFVIPPSPCDTPMDTGVSPSLVSSVDANMLSLAQGLFTSIPNSTSFVNPVTSSFSPRPPSVLGHVSPISSISGSYASSTLPYVTSSLGEAPPLHIDLSPSASPPYVDSMPFSQYPLATSPTSSIFPPLPPLPPIATLLPPRLPSVTPPTKDSDDIISLHAGDASFLESR